MINEQKSPLLTTMNSQGRNQLLGNFYAQLTRIKFDTYLTFPWRIAPVHSCPTSKF